MIWQYSGLFHSTKNPYPDRYPQCGQQTSVILVDDSEDEWYDALSDFERWLVDECDDEQSTLTAISYCYRCKIFGDYSYS